MDFLFKKQMTKYVSFPIRLFTIKCIQSFLFIRLKPTLYYHTTPSELYGGGSILEQGYEKISSINAELQAIREEKSITNIEPLLRCSITKMQEKPYAVAKLLEREGCLSITNVLSKKSCEILTKVINLENERSKNDVVKGLITFDERFGGVNCRGINGLFGVRQDMYLPMEYLEVQKALKESFTNLSPLLNSTVSLDGTIHEISCFVADPTAPRQCVHADTIVLPCPQYPTAQMKPIYTFFIALQDVEDSMGHTQFFPRTHTSDVHTIWNSKSVQQDTPKFIGLHNAVQSNLRMGDVAIFDSRLLHCGLPNTSTDKRRIIFYFSVSEQRVWPLPNGLHGPNSIRSHDKLKWTINDVMKL